MCACQLDARARTWECVWISVRLPAIAIAIASSAAPKECAVSSRVREAVVTPVRPPAEAKPKPPPPQLPPLDKLPSVADEIVVRALDIGRAAFNGCFARARRADPTLRVAKVALHVVLDAAGKVLAVETDVTDERFKGCLVRVARGLAFPAPGRMAVAHIAFVAS